MCFGYGRGGVGRIGVRVGGRAATLDRGRGSLVVADVFEFCCCWVGHGIVLWRDDACPRAAEVEEAEGRDLAS